MHISSNEISSQNQLAMGGVTHKLIYILMPLYFINVRQTLLSYSNTYPHVLMLRRPYTYTQFLIKLGLWQFKVEEPTLIGCQILYQLGIKQKVMRISSNEIPSQKQLAMGRVTHKLIYILKPLYFINAGQTLLSYSNMKQQSAIPNLWFWPLSLDSDARNFSNDAAFAIIVDWHSRVS